MLRLATFIAGLAFVLTPAAQAANTACAPSAATVPVAQASASSFQLTSADGICLQGYQWAPVGAPRGVVIVAHGLRDHSNRYARLIAPLVAQGLVVQAQDMRGHGASGGDRQRFDSVDDLVADLSLGITRARATRPNLPVFVFGHSMGGMTAATYAARPDPQIRGVILSAPFLVLPENASRFEQVIGRAIAAVAPGAKIQKLDDTVFLREESARRALATDPLVDHSDLPAASARAALNGVEAIAARMSSVSVPLLILHGLADESTSIAGSRLLVKTAKSSDKTLREIPVARHDLTNEPEGPQLALDIAKWVGDRL
ncbi:MAG TPA: alpha/beta hydrolase [Polaromonas sp.]|uniref:alpha/beta hydrolase n=1 Tax=Polaromonas sp. TaxID=1869339 RepID=UPI002D52471B|nr:lysophospholipase [Polaromonas sp.]HYW57159.1 alpha/beta hydrolase [Polaromonas sp.]